MRNPEHTRSKLITTATQLLLSKGPEGLRVDEVASIAAVNKRMIYHYFDNKEGLLEVVLRSQVALLVNFADVFSLGVKAFLAEHFTLTANNPDRQNMLKTDNNAVSSEEISAANRQQSLRDAGLIVLRALLDQRQFTVRLSAADKASLGQGLMALALPQLYEVEQVARSARTISKRPLTQKPRYTIQAQLRYSE